MANSFLKTLASAAVVLLLATLLPGCAGKAVNENDPKEMYEDADQDVQGDRYLLALDKLRVIKSKFSYSNYGALAQLRIGDVYFLQESYPEAAASYEAFSELYPKHEKASYAIFRAGEAYFKDIPSTIARDLHSAESAVRALSQYLSRYPGGEYSARAEEMKSGAYNKLAEKELEIARFYIKRKKPASARQRLEKIIDLYPGTATANTARNLLEHLPSE